MSMYKLYIYVPHVLIVVCGKYGTLASYFPEGTDGCSDKASWKISSLTSKSTTDGISDSSVDPWEGSSNADDICKSSSQSSPVQTFLVQVSVFSS